MVLGSESIGALEDVDDVPLGLDGVSRDARRDWSSTSWSSVWVEGGSTAVVFWRTLWSEGAGVEFIEASSPDRE